VILLFESSTCFEQLLRMCSSSGWQLYEYNFLYNHSVSVAVLYAGLDLHTGRPLTQIDYTRTQLSSWGWAHSCSKHVEDSNKRIIEETVCQVGYLPELYEDARSEKYLKSSFPGLNIGLSSAFSKTFTTSSSLTEVRDQDAHPLHSTDNLTKVDLC
jgi:hypothetical protein